MNPMEQIRIEKITLNIGAGKEQKMVDKGLKLLGQITGNKPVKTLSRKRIAGWGIRVGLPIGCKVTVRGNKTKELLTRLLHAKDNKLSPDQFDDGGNVSFGIPECIDIKGMEYDPEIGIIGLEASVTLEKPGYRIKRRRIKQERIHHSHQITKEEAIAFLQKEFNISIGQE